MQTKKKYINLLVYLFLLIGISLLPPAEPLTALGMRTIAIMIASIWAWCTMDLIWPSIAALVLLGLSGYGTVQAAFASAMSNNTTMLIFFMLLFSGISSVSGLGDALALRIVNMKIAQGRPWLLTALIVIATYIPAFVIGYIPALLVSWGIIYSISDQLGIEKKSSWVSYIIFMTCVASILAMNVMPFQVSAAAFIGFCVAADPTVSISYVPWILFTFFFQSVMIGLFMFVSKLIKKPDVSKLANYQVKENIPPFTFEQRWALRLTGLLFLFLMVPNMLPKSWGIYRFFSQIGTVGIVAIIIALSQFIFKDGKQLFPFKSMANNGLVWQVLFMSASSMTVSNAMTSSETGVSAFLSQTIAGIGWLRGYAFGLVLLLVALLTTNALNGGVIGLITATLLFTVGKDLGVNPMAYCALLLIAGNSGFMFPSSSTNGAMLYSNGEWISKRSIIEYSAILIIVFAVMFSIGIPIADLIW